MRTLAPAKQFVDVDGIRVGYLDVGRGEPLLLIHGLGQSSTAWLRCIEALAQHRRVIAPDLPGFGESDIPEDAPFGPRFYARMVAGFVRVLDLDRVAAVGHSAGALALSLAALDAPRTFERVVLVDPAGFTPAPDNLLGAAAASLIRLVVGVPRTRAMTRALYHTAFYDPHAADDETVDEIALRRAHPRGKLASRRAFVRHFEFCQRLAPFHERLSDLEAPVLVIWGSDDRLFHASDSAVARRVIPRARLEVIERCGHCPQIEHPQRFADLVLEFLAGT